jgi:hypothetical protein
MSQPNQHDHADHGADQWWQRGRRGGGGPVQCSDHADHAKQSDADDAGDCTSHRKPSDHEGGDCQGDDDADAQRQLVAGAKPLDRQFLEPSRHSVDEPAADRVDW